LATTRRLYAIKSHVANDTDALTSASKRHDRDFLHSIQTKLASPSPPTLNHNKSFGPPPSRSAYYAAAAAASHAPRDSRRRTWIGPTASRVDDYEVAAYLATPVRPPFVSRVLRGSSVPPVLPSRASAPRWYPASSRGSSVPRWAPSSYRTYGGGRSYLQSHPDMEDMVVGVAPTALYGDIVIGIPYRKQFMFGVQHGLDAVEDYHRHPVATRVTSPYFAYKNRPLYDSLYDDVDVTPYRRSTYASPSSYVPQLHARPYVSPPSAPYVPGARISHYGYPVARAPAARLAHAHSEYELDLATPRAPPRESLSNLRLRATLARDKANEHKTLLDRYLPADLGRPPIGVSHSYDASNRGLTGGNAGWPSTDFRATAPTHSYPSTGSSTAAAAATGGASSSKPFKPQISETRQRVRELLCKSKRDPHYFD
jgi:hypothetical protein